MDTAARRESLVRLMRRRGHVTIEQLAEELSVSRRTVLRDLGALRDRGFSIDSESGPGGGVRMDPQTVLVSTQLAADEVVALVLSVAVLRATPSMPFSGRAERALAKIEGALPAARVRQLRRLVGRVLVGDPAAVGRGDPPGAVDATLLAAFERAFTQRLVLRFDYEDRHGRRSRRTVEPHGLLVRAPLWYVIAWDPDRDAARLFRMDRIRRAKPVDGATFPNRPLDLVASGCPDATAVPGARGRSKHTT